MSVSINVPFKSIYPGLHLFEHNAHFDPDPQTPTAADPRRARPQNVSQRSLLSVISHKEILRGKTANGFWTSEIAVLQICNIYKEVEIVRVPQLSADALFAHDGMHRANNLLLLHVYPTVSQGISAQTTPRVPNLECKDYSNYVLYCLRPLSPAGLHNNGQFPICCNTSLGFLH
jgi:hypothetical protein